jgi:hypothetical protein
MDRYCPKLGPQTTKTITQIKNHYFTDARRRVSARSGPPPHVWYTTPRPRPTRRARASRAGARYPSPHRHASQPRARRVFTCSVGDQHTTALPAHQSAVTTISTDHSKREAQASRSARQGQGVPSADLRADCPARRLCGVRVPATRRRRVPRAAARAGAGRPPGARAAAPRRPPRWPVAVRACP